jgi:hypothetical protein
MYLLALMNPTAIKQIMGISNYSCTEHQELE